MVIQAMHRLMIATVRVSCPYGRVQETYPWIVRNWKCPPFMSAMGMFATTSGR